MVCKCTFHIYTPVVVLYYQIYEQTWQLADVVMHNGYNIYYI